MNRINTIIIGLALVFAAYLISNIQRKTREFDRSVQVKGLAEREVPADIAVWPVQITVVGNDLKALETNLEEQKSVVQGFFSSMGFDADEMRSGMTNIQDAQANAYVAPNLAYRYIAKWDFTVRTSKIDKIQKALDESSQLIEQDIILGSKNNWRPIEYIFSGLNELKPEMIEEATKNAKEVAEKFALDSDSKVGKIKSANQGFFSINDRDMNTPEIKIVRVVSTIDYYLED